MKENFNDDSHAGFVIILMLMCVKRLTSLSVLVSLSLCSSRLSRWWMCISASARRRVRSWSSSLTFADRPLLCSISSSFLMDSSRALSVCFCVSMRSSISSRVFLRRNSSLACLSCSPCSRWKLSSVSSAEKGSPGRAPTQSCWNSWLRSRWMRSSSWRAWMVTWRCWERDRGEKSFTQIH